MEKIASDMATRIWTFLSQYPLMSSTDASTIVKEKIKLLNTLALLERDLIDTETVLTSWDDTAIASSFYRFGKFVSQFDRLFVRNFDRFNSKFGAKTTEKQEIINKEEKLDTSFIKKDIGFIPAIMEMLNQQGINTDELNGLWQEVSEIEDESIYDKYSKLLFKANELSNTKLNSLEAISEALLKINKEKTSNYHPELQKLARKRIQRFLNRLRLNLSRNLDSKRVLELAKIMNDTSKNMNLLQDCFEDKETDIDAIRYYVRIIYESISNICNEFYGLVIDYNNYVGEHNIDNKKKLHLIRSTDIYLMKKRAEYFTGLMEKV